ncbi:MAG: ABC transporter ATP-binding protein, partial [Candidatus Zixiibacteriota bacterium]
LLGLVKVTSGTASILGLPPNDPASRNNVGFLPENHRFPDYLTGQALLDLTGRMYAMKRADIKSQADRLLELVDMQKWADMVIRKYSKGMLQRIGLAQAMMPDPEILLLDEPTDGVDPVGKVDIRRVLETIRDEGKTIVLNSHLLGEVESVADRAAILQYGKLIRVSSIDDLTRRSSHYEIEANFGERLIDIPQEVGTRISITANKMVVELVEEDKINYIIDDLRMKKIAIRAVKPLKVSLEQSFIETISQPKGGSASEA